MALRALVGGVPDALGTAAVPPERVVLVGARERDAAEDLFLAESGIRHLTDNALADPAALEAAVAATGAARVSVHIDLDVTAPARKKGVEVKGWTGIVASGRRR